MPHPPTSGSPAHGAHPPNGFSDCARVAEVQLVRRLSMSAPYGATAYQYFIRGYSPLVNRIGFVQLEPRDFHVEVIAVFSDHLVGTAHHAGSGLERAPRPILKCLAGREYGLLADDAGAANLLQLAVRVGNQPMTAEELDRVLAFV